MASSREQADDQDQEVLIASYIWHGFVWMKGVAERIKDRSSEATHLLQGLRNKLKTDENKWYLGRGEEEVTLHEVSAHLFPNSGKKARITNVYAKASNGRKENEELQSWTPDGSSRRNATNFLAEIIPHC